MSPDALNDDYEPGWQIAARYDLGPLSVLEATYMGLYDLGFTDTRNSLAETELFFGVPQQDQLNSVFSGYGANPDPGPRRRRRVHARLPVRPAEHRAELPPLLAGLQHRASPAPTWRASATSG